jgi:hypothetical protein
LASGETAKTHAVFPPEEPPYTLTLSGSPPNLLILCLIHFNAVITSRIPFKPPVPNPFFTFSSNAPNPYNPTLKFNVILIDVVDYATDVGIE